MTTAFCANHKSTETVLRCGKCEKPICPRCVIFTPVGTRCRECAHLTRLPTYNISPAFLARGAAAGLSAGIGVGLLLGYLLGEGIIPALYLLGPFAIAGLAYLTAEVVSLATNRKRGPPLQAIAAVSWFLGYLALEALTPGLLVLTLWGIAAFIVSIAVILGRLR
ncbi:MAG: hypothetical protein FJ315_00590 [SAR202 cluster bacterium]|nr:hypothetical protein [SAR202 cluster bacterium]